MSQYYPAGRNPYAKDKPRRRLTKEEYDTSLAWIKEFGIKGALIQRW
jgi:uncharacterized Fe-S radical SAM superfamily protein PflX